MGLLFPLYKTTLLLHTCEGSEDEEQRVKLNRHIMKWTCFWVLRSLWQIVCMLSASENHISKYWLFESLVCYWLFSERFDGAVRLIRNFVQKYLHNEGSGQMEKAVEGVTKEISIWWYKSLFEFVSTAKQSIPLFQKKPLE